MKELKFDDVFKPPFKVYYPMIFDSKERISLTAICSEEIAHRIILKLNGKTDKKLKNGHVSYCDGELFFNKDGKSIKIMLVRGWGRLTGIGGLKLDGELAAKLQDDLGKWIVDKLNN